MELTPKYDANGSKGRNEVEQKYIEAVKSVTALPDFTLVLPSRHRFRFADMGSSRCALQHLGILT